MKEPSHTDPADAGLIRVFPAPLSEPVHQAIHTLTGKPTPDKPDDYQQPKMKWCESNCLLVMWALAKKGILARIAYGVAMPPADWYTPPSKQWLTHAWLIVGEERYDPTYELAWKRDVSKVTYFEHFSVAYDALPTHVRGQLDGGWRPNFELSAEDKKMRALGIDAYLA
ncbi:hypothetical protein [Corallococcus sp. AS-1-12]|uniref:hypothetical protein n=1 Tax=Corallococcus sp. AS-1-12 TaxID=2874598 RepID=UPI001CBBB101|nr:hypothetical protein [Corallococcus sp. AS-1-12]MBZ4335070.1 hypothetical protein [Corallococcus sp. AS-1-12]